MNNYFPSIIHSLNWARHRNVAPNKAHSIQKLENEGRRLLIEDTLEDDAKNADMAQHYDTANSNQSKHTVSKGRGGYLSEDISS